MRRFLLSTKVVWMAALFAFWCGYMADLQAKSPEREDYFFQDRVVSGTVIDETGKGLPGVNVLIKGTTNGGVTDVDGKFSINVPSPDVTVVFSFIGYVTVEEPLNGRQELNITLSPDVKTLSEIVVVGYGTQKKETLTGSVSQISNNDINTTRSTSLVSNLQGKIPGVQIRQQSGEPGLFTSMVSIRGFGSPLVVIDGVARDGMADLERLNPNDIETISVLKDASATIYGMNADNGVIIVTTKKGARGTTTFNYSAFAGVKTPTGMERTVDAYTYRLFRNEMERNIRNAPMFSKEVLEGFKNGTEPGFQDTDWMDVTLKDYATQHQHNLSLSGGSDKVTYYTSLGFQSDNGLLKSDIQKYRKYNFRNTMEAQLTERLHAKLIAAGKYDQNKSPQGSYFWLFKPIMTSDRGYGIYTLNTPGHLTRIPPENQNPYALMTESISGYDKYTNFQYQTTLALTYDVPGIKGLKLGVQGAYDGNINNSSNLRKGYYLYDYVTDAPANTPLSTYQDGNTQFSRLDFQGQIFYKNSFNNEHNVGLTLVHEIMSTRTNFLFAKRQYDDVYTHDIIDQGSLTNATNGGYRNETALLSYLGRFNYDFREKYLLEFAFRYDGSYRYAPSQRWAFFPSVSAGWRLSEESFIKDNLSFVSNLKIRAAYGKMGADAGNPFEYYAGYRFGAIDGGYVFNNNVLTLGMIAPGVVNDNLTWVKSRNMNVGIDVELWNGLLGITSDIFQKNRDGLLGNRIQNIPNIFGASFPQENINSDLVRGIELMLSHENNVGDITYSISANATYARRYLVHTERKPYASSMEEWKDPWGSERYLGREWGYEYDGRYTDITQYETAPLIGNTAGNANMLPGSYRIDDVNGDGVINANDMLPNMWSGQYQGFANNPPLQYGMNVGVKWRNLDANVLLQGAALYTVFTKVDDIWGYGRYPTLLEKYTDRWHTADPAADPYHPATEWVPGKYPALRSNVGGTTDGLITDRWRLNAKHLRVKSVEIGYTLPADISRRIGSNNLRVYVNGFNLFTFASDDLKGLDPEREEGQYQADLTYPLMKSYNIGVSANF